MSITYDVIVVGLGGMGTAAAHALAARGRRVLGLDRYAPGHAHGSSHGHTRIIREAYYEHPAYVPLVRRAFAGWYHLEQLTGAPLLVRCPCLTAGPENGELVTGVRAAAVEHHIPVEDLSADEVTRRFPPFRLPAHFRGVVEPAAGFLFVEACVKAQAAAAVALGADLRTDEAVEVWQATASGVTVRTKRGTYHAAKLVIAAGAWAAELLREVGVLLTVMRQVQHWFPVGSRAADFRRDRFPIFLADTPDGAFYGLPALGPDGIKVARHYGAPELTSPDGRGLDTDTRRCHPGADLPQHPHP